MTDKFLLAIDFDSMCMYNRILINLFWKCIVSSRPLMLGQVIV